jgi:hypothetical protein
MGLAGVEGRVSDRFSSRAVLGEDSSSPRALTAVASNSSLDDLSSRWLDRITMVNPEPEAFHVEAVNGAGQAPFRCRRA